MNRGEYVRTMREIGEGRDIELRHQRADALLCELLVELGFQEVVAEYERINKVYA